MSRKVTLQVLPSDLRLAGEALAEAEIAIDQFVPYGSSLRLRVRDARLKVLNQAEDQIVRTE